MRVLTITGLVLALAAASACGKSEQQKQAEEAAKQLDQASKQMQQAANEASKQMEQAGKEAGKNGGDAAAQAAKGLEAFAKGLQGMAATGPDGKPVNPVSFHDLQTVFVPLDGWEMGKATGEKMTSPVSYSQAKVTYRKGESSIDVSVMDSGFNQLLVAPFMMFLTQGYEKETENGYEKSVKVGGNPGWEKWDSGGKDGQLAAFVNKRFLVQFEGRQIDDTKVLYQLAQASNIAKLSSLK
jgi:hypothetical protein